MTDVRYNGATAAGAGGDVEGCALMDLSKLTPAPWEVRKDDDSGTLFIPRPNGFPMLLEEQDDPVPLEFAALARNAFDGDPDALAWWEANRKRGNGPVRGNSGGRSRNMTVLEKLLTDFGDRKGWGKLRPEWIFHPRRKWRFDFAWPNEFIAIEIDGGTWRPGGGAHKGKGFIRDLEKGREAVLLGWRVLRFTPQERDNGTVLSVLERMAYVPGPSEH